MRFSSIKSVVAALSIAVMLVVAVPAADARPAKSRETSSARSREDARKSNTVFRAIQRLLNRFFGGPTSNALPAPPLPTEEEMTFTPAEIPGA